MREQPNAFTNMTRRLIIGGGVNGIAFLVINADFTVKIFGFRNKC